MAGWRLGICFGGLSCVWLGVLAAESQPIIKFNPEPGKVRLMIDGKPLATYVYADPQLPRPYFVSVCAPGGIQVTRNYPPIPGKDATDHATWHPGLWLAFGNLSGHDCWRLKARVKHQRFVEPPAGRPGQGIMTVCNRYVTATPPEKTICEEVCRYTILVRPTGYLWILESTFHAGAEPVSFGDQEEMGLGIRMATPLTVNPAAGGKYVAQKDALHAGADAALTVKGNGRILDSEGRVNQPQIWGKSSRWCDYSGVIDGRRVGMTLMPDPSNFRPSWFHARDYGLLVANPFGRKAFTGGEPSEVVVKPGETLRLRYGVWVHADPADVVPDLKAAYDDFRRLLAEPVKLLFSGPQDVADTWGKLQFGATPMQKIRDCANPGFEVSGCFPREDGAWDVFGQAVVTRRGKGPSMAEEQNAWKLIHATTRDGLQFENAETVFESKPEPWANNHAMAYNPKAKEFMLLKLKVDPSGFRYTAFFSPDGRNWKEHPQSPLFYDGDAISLFWSPTLQRLICVSKSLQPVSKHIPDHGGKVRRVLSIRSSRDGRHWEPADSMEDVWNRSGRWKALPDKLLTVPDGNDPPDLEFYSGNGFWYHDRSYMLVLNYAASPLVPHKHGPQLDTEWWVSRDGLRWERPYRDVNALGDAFPGYPRITHNPMMIDGQLLFRFGNHLVGMKQDRISYAGARANAEFSTLPFPMPATELHLNAAIPSPERAFATQQAYVMAALLDEQGNVVPGFEAEKCVLRNADKINLPLRWGDKSARELAGRQIRLRFHLRSANIYAVTSGN